MHSRLASRMLKTNFKSSFIPIQACEHIIHEFTAFVKSVQQESLHYLAYLLANRAF